MFVRIQNLYLIRKKVENPWGSNLHLLGRGAKPATYYTFLVHHEKILYLFVTTNKLMARPIRDGLQRCVVAPANGREIGAPGQPLGKS
jgi:hypothetical protein